MFRLTGSDLPTRQTAIKPVPAIKLWHSNSRILAPLVCINRVQPTESEVSGSLGNPDAIAYYQKFDLGVTINAVKIPSLIEVTENPELNKTLNCYWFDGTNLHIIYNQLPSSIKISVSQNLDDNDFSAIAIPVGLTVQQICTNGLTYTIGTNPGNFQQSGNSLAIYTSAQYRLIVGGALELIGDYALTSGDFLRVVAFSIPEIDYLDSLDWLGCAFTPSEDVLNPVVADFFWSNNVVFLFTDKKNLPAPQITHTTGRSVIGSLNV